MIGITKIKLKHITQDIFKLRFIFILAFFLLKSSDGHPLDLKGLFQNEYLQFKETLSPYSYDEFTKPNAFLKETSQSKYYLNDPKSLIRSSFRVTPFFYPKVLFWFSIYTQFHSDQFIIHDKDNLFLVYGVFNFSKLKNASLNPYKKEFLRNKIINEKIKDIKNTLLKLEKSPQVNTPLTNEMLIYLKNSNIKIPSTLIERKKLFSYLRENIRIQAGQKDKIINGFINSIPFNDFLYKYLKVFQLPEELIAIPFLESSFNTKAKSRIGASGLWQFIMLTGKIFFNINSNIDGRLGPLLSTIGAFHFLKSNFRILKRWDLTVTSYNTGNKHLLLAKKKLNVEEISLEEIIKKYKHPHLGFASLNFYSEFLALVHVLAYKEDLLLPHSRKIANVDLAAKKDLINKSAYKIYISLCDFIPQKLFTENFNNDPFIELANLHIRNPQKKYPRNTILFMRNTLSEKKFYLMKDNEVTERFPKHWSLMAANYNCSMR